MALLGQIKMGIMLITFKIMPEAIETDLNRIEIEAKEVISIYEGSFVSSKKEPVAFGLNSLSISFSLNENKEIDPIEDQIRNIEGVISIEVSDMRRMIG